MYPRVCRAYSVCTTTHVLCTWNKKASSPIPPPASINSNINNQKSSIFGLRATPSTTFGLRAPSPGGFGLRATTSTWGLRALVNTVPRVRVQVVTYNMNSKTLRSPPEEMFLNRGVWVKGLRGNAVCLIHVLVFWWGGWYVLGGWCIVNTCTTRPLQPSMMGGYDERSTTTTTQTKNKHTHKQTHIPSPDKEPSPDMYVIGSQETGSFKEWKQQLQDVLGAGYVRLASHSLMQIGLVVFVRRMLRHRCGHVHKDAVPTGMICE